MAEKRKKRTRGIRDYLRLAVHERLAPDAIALGMCIGLFVGLAPLYGFQVVLALLLALLLRGSKLAAVLAVCITNPFTAFPIYSFTYWLGTTVLGDPMREKSFRTLWRFCLQHFRWDSLDEAHRVMGEVFRLGRGIFPALFVGGLIAGLIASAIAYPLTKVVVLRLRAARSHRLRNRQPKWRRTKHD